MLFEEFKSGYFKQQYQYKSFMPTLVNQEWSWQDPRLNVLLEKATKALGELNASTLIIPNVDLFISMHITKEANTSSRIEGTQTVIEEAVLEEEEIDPERRDDWREVQNYIQAMNRAIESLDELPLSMRLLRQTHETLMQGVRGEWKTPGEFRRSQNWIGGASLNDAVFIPPHHSDVPEFLSDLEAFWHNENIHVPHLIKIAISHYQFETIHPFLDGNGRIGRLLITLYLMSHGLLSKPSLYLSAHLEKHRDSYYDALSRVRQSHDLGHWCRFFLQAIVETAENGVATLQGIMLMNDELEGKVSTLGRLAENARLLLRYLYKRPVVTINLVMKEFDMSYQRAGRLVDAMRQIGILKEATGHKRNRLFVFQRYLLAFNQET